MRRILLSIIMAVMSLSTVMAQKATKPRIMVRPAEAWCSENGYMKEEKIGGKTEKFADYEEALKSNGDLTLVISKIEALMNDRGFRIANFLQAIKSAKEKAVRNSGVTSKESGSNIATSFMDEINNQAKADIYFDVYWKVTKNGPKNTVSYMLSGIDTYTENSVASTSGSGTPSFSAEVPILVEEAVTSRMDAFLNQLQGYFDDCIDNGRPVRIEINTFGNGVDMETEFGGKELREIIEDWMSDNTVNRSYNLVDDTETSMVFQEVRIPLFDAKERPMNAGTFGRELTKKLQSLGIKVKQGKKTLGLCQLILGEK